MVRGRSKQPTRKENVMSEEDDDFDTRTVIKESYREDSYRGSSESIDSYDTKIEDDIKESFEENYTEDSARDAEKIDGEIPEMEDVADSLSAVDEYRKPITEEANERESIDRKRNLPKRFTRKIKKKVGFLTG